MTSTKIANEESNKDEKKNCFVIMPISDPATYKSGHFRRVYEDIFIPAIEEAGYNAIRADDNKSSNLIQVNIIKEIVNTPMAICDLSTRNPNVLFELGIRQAFDLPVVLVQEEGTDRIFDISTINTIEYRKERIYDQVLEDRKKITEGLLATSDTSKGVNSIIKLLKINNANIDINGDISNKDETNLMLNAIMNELNSIKRDLSNRSLNKNNLSTKYNQIYSLEEISKYSNKIYEIEEAIDFYEKVNERIPEDLYLNCINLLKSIIVKSKSIEEQERINNLLSRIKKMEVENQ